MLGTHDAVHAKSCYVSLGVYYFLLVLPSLASLVHCLTSKLIRIYQELHSALTDPNNSWLKKKVLGVLYAVIGVLSRPAYAVPLLLNVTGSVWFFILIGKAELSLTVPITNSLAFLFTVLGEWWAEKKVISRGTLSLCSATGRKLTMQRHMDWHGLCTWWYRVVRPEQIVKCLSILLQTSYQSFASLLSASVTAFS